MISAIICTHNRSFYLSKAIQSLVEQTLDRSQFEIIVVDNKSTDDTHNIVHGKFSFVSNLKYLYEPVLGLSQARNTGWQKAEGKYVAYLDDDAIARNDWLKNILHAYRKAIPEPGIICGKVNPIWEIPRPVWLPEGLLGALSIVDWSKDDIILNGSQWPAGVNISFPKKLLEIVGGFNTSLGRKGGNLLSMEENDIRAKIEKIGFSCYYSPEIVVSHHLPASRLTKRWFMRRYYWQGISDAVHEINIESPHANIKIRKALVELKKQLRSRHKIRCVILPTNNSMRFESKCLSIMTFGYIIGLLKSF